MKEYSRFDKMVTELLNVPHSEIKAKLEVGNLGTDGTFSPLFELLILSRYPFAAKSSQ
ncbi:MAG TPA: hypothetical protein VK805_20290 [Candidatus Baltobacteraceae bacterium]|jgi:hypothetical protein|nr:hypothetical protein [Candidatus Baltobacteraceae bacterium]